MKKIHNWKQFNENSNIFSISDLEHMSNWIEKFWDKIANYDQDDINVIFNSIEDEFGIEVASIIDGMYSADKLHYHQSGKTSMTGVC